MSITRRLPLLLFLAVAWLAFPPSAYAYLDPGAGSYLFQLLLAGLLASLFAIKSFWAQIKDFLRSHFSRKQRS